MGSTNWFRYAIIYHILIDRFAGFKSRDNWDKPIFIGGNIRGIIEKLHYLDDLGIDTIWISPFYKTSAYHGYHITDFYNIDPHFGTLKDLKELIRLVHDRNMKIIADFVPNHCSEEHPFFKEAQHDRKSDYYKWFYFLRWPDDYLCFLSVRDLPKINLDYPPARYHIIDAAKFWISCGFDGFRLDHVIGPSDNFWKEFKREVKKENSSFVLIGEAWMKGIRFSELKTLRTDFKLIKWLFGSSSDMLLRSYYKLLDGVLDFRLQELIRDNVAKEDINKTREKLTIKIEKHYRKFPADYFLPAFLDNHDMNRFLFECNNDKEKLKEASRILFSLKQPIVIYYGTEVGLSQERSIWDYPAHGDLQARQPMKWENVDEDLLNFYKKLIAERRKQIKN